MQFDENEYREEFLRKHRGELRRAPGDLLTRYAITVPATDAEIAAQVQAVRAYWNKIYSGMSGIGQVAKLCRTEDERLRREHGANMETLAWWQARQTDTQRAAKESIAIMADDKCGLSEFWRARVPARLERWCNRLDVERPLV